ncbi:DUF6090 family protein [Algoriphagus namhaensis]|uniref:DUF6090 family protein n=1 Tax=Algoriphagus namhaensis TaxID=915353 RepID=A0ABV8AWV8_9BACT
MIKFFRKIRQKLLSENKFSKYLIYAIGEIILVVIGILIALQINNDNQEKLNRNYEVTMLREIQDALEEDIKNMEGGLENIAEVKKSVFKLASIRSDPSYPQDSLAYHFSEVRRGGITIAVNYSPYESIKSTGLDKISNSDLRNSITNLYEVQLKGVEFWVNDFIRRQLYKRGDLVATLFEKEVRPDSIKGIEVEYLINEEVMQKDEFDDFMILSGGFIPIAERYISVAIRNMKSQVKEIELELSK